MCNTKYNSKGVASNSQFKVNGPVCIGIDILAPVVLRRIVNWA